MRQASGSADISEFFRDSSWLQRSFIGTKITFSLSIRWTSSDSFNVDDVTHDFSTVYWQRWVHPLHAALSTTFGELQRWNRHGHSAQAWKHNSFQAWNANGGEIHLWSNFKTSSHKIFLSSFRLQNSLNFKTFRRKACRTTTTFNTCLTTLPMRSLRNFQQNVNTPSAHARKTSDYKLEQMSGKISFVLSVTIQNSKSWKAFGRLITRRNLGI